MKRYRVAAILVLSGLICISGACASESHPAETNSAIPAGSDKYRELEAKLAKEFGDFYKGLPNLRELSRTKTHELRVLYVEDPDLPKLSATQKTELLRGVEGLSLKLLGYRIKLSSAGRETIDDFFSRMTPAFEREEFLYPVRYWSLDISQTEEIKKVIVEQSAKHKRSVLVKYFGDPGAALTLEEHIYDVFMKRLRSIYNEKDLRGAPLYNPGRRNKMSFPYWSVIAYNVKKADIIITNLLMAGPDTGMPIYVINRGGITSAFVDNNIHNKYQGAIMFFTYQYLSNGPFFRKYRGKIPRKDLIPVMAYLMTHELGHLLARLPEYYDLEGSVHVAPRDLNYLKWYRGIRPGNHPIADRLRKTLKKY